MKSIYDEIRDVIRTTEMGIYLINSAMRRGIDHELWDRIMDLDASLRANAQKEALKNAIDEVCRSM